MGDGTLYQNAMGAAFDELPSAVRRFHLLAGRHELHGWVETEAPRSLLARALAWCLGTPLTASAGPIRFELDASPLRETWTRHFPSQSMRSILYPGGPFVVSTAFCNHNQTVCQN